MKSLSTRTKVLVAALGIVGVTTGAFAVGNVNIHQSEAVAATQAKISLNQAISIAAQQVQGTLMSAGFDDDRGGSYEVEIANGQTSHEVNINAHTGKVIGVKQEALDNDDVLELNAQKQAKVNLSQALQHAAKHVGGQAVGGEFSSEHGASHYEVDVIKGTQVYEVIVDANTGAIVSSQLDD